MTYFTVRAICVGGSVRQAAVAEGSVTFHSLRQGVLPLRVANHAARQTIRAKQDALRVSRPSCTATAGRPASR
ncbi:conserved protein of unknown function [Pseudomonas marincola]|uniref:Uncharacterized protein n=1 Tax=Pseudomonas marincola TaxID=437900 RepID=A0A653E160_9PSED|nr:conserved protein of unknown function [Pseudomonas marincola]